MTNETKLDCVGEFMSACDNSNPQLLSQSVGALADLLDGGADCEFIKGFAEALLFAVEKAEESSDAGDADPHLDSILEFCHTSLAKAYTRKIGRA